MICSELICIFLLSFFCIQNALIKQAKAHKGLSLCPYVTTSCVAGRGHGCALHRSHDNDNSSKIDCGLTWCSNKVKCLIDIWSDWHISQMLDITHKNIEVYNIVTEGMKKWRQQHRKVRDYIVHTHKWSFGACCQAEHIKTVGSGLLCSHCKELFQGSNGVKWRPALKGSLDPVVLFYNRVLSLCSHMSKWTNEPKEKCPFLECLLSIQEWKHSYDRFLCVCM